MLYPKKKDQMKYMGKRCQFTSEYYREYGGIILERDVQSGQDTITPISWKIEKHPLKFGWVVGFGFCYNGQIRYINSFGEKYRKFEKNKMVKYIKVKCTPTGPEIKIPSSDLRLIT